MWPAVDSTHRYEVGGCVKWKSFRGGKSAGKTALLIYILLRAGRPSIKCNAECSWGRLNNPAVRENSFAGGCARKGVKDFV